MRFPLRLPLRGPFIRITVPLLLAVAAASHDAAAQSACDAVTGNLVANCGFERGTFSGWTFSGGAFDNGVDQYSVHSGTWGAYLGGSSPATLTQTLATTPGTRYTYSFWLLSEDPTYLGTAFFRVLVNGQPLFDLERQATGAYTSYGFSAVAAGASTQLQLVAENVPSFYDVDDVVVAPAVAAVPEPVTGALVGGGILLVAAAGWRRRAADGRRASS